MFDDPEGIPIAIAALSKGMIFGSTWMTTPKKLILDDMKVVRAMAHGEPRRLLPDLSV